MDKDIETASSAMDTVKWIVVVLLVSVTIFGNYYFDEEALLYRVIGVLVVGLLALFVYFKTVQGQAFSDLLREARVEVKKVVWPTRQETLQTTLMVVVVVFVMSLALWGFDTFLGFLVSKLLA